ncbi:hypothetical protein [Clostridium tagluense]|uniref:hypothetical protein n=1 Tax=Clostridium tagluense TaxID=360422 RepID=UPI001C0AA568|nr:hypothetical protein [Clostridium tagluense]MBU3130276.1 hypothetical protein [Clostridium tagluense]
MGLRNTNLELFLRKYNMEDILSGIIEMQLCGSEQLIATRIPASEYLASNAICLCKYDSDIRFMWSDYLKLEEFASNIYNDDIEKLFSETLSLVDASDNVKQDFLKSQQMKLKNMAFRGDGYIYQLVSLAEQLYKPFDTEIKDKLGFTFSCCERMMIYIFKSYGYKAFEAHNKKYKNMFKSFIKIVQGKSEFMLPSIKDGYIFRVYKKELYTQFEKEEVDNILKYISVPTDSRDLTISEVSEFKVLTSKPFVDFGEYIYMPILESTLMNLPKLFHYTFIAEKIFDKYVVGQYTKNRGDVIEDLTVRYLSRLVNKSNIHQSLKYKGEDGEADVTVQIDNCTLFCECKSKTLTLGALKGITGSLKKDVYQAIGAAYSQGIPSIEWVQDGKSFFEIINGEEREITLNNSPIKLIICVTAENFGIIPSEIYNYVEIDEDTSIVPYVVNIYDFDIVTQECSDFNELVSYLQFRQENNQILSSMDELDVLGFFKVNGNEKIKLNADVLMVTDFTKRFDKKYKKYNQELFAKF